MPSMRVNWPNYIAPPGYAANVMQTWGHSPIPIRLVSLAPYYAKGGPTDPDSSSFQLWVNGTNTGPVVTLSSGSGYVQDLPQKIDIPAVDASNVDGASRFGLSVPDGGTMACAIGYEVINAADTGKTVWGIGSMALCTTLGDSNGRFAPLVMHEGDVTVDGDVGSDVFRFKNESSAPIVAGDTNEIAVVPFAVTCTLDDFVFVERGGSGPGAAVSFVLRVNGGNTIAIDLAVSSTRLWFPTGDTSIVIPAGSLVCWQQVGSGDIDGELLCTCRVGDVSSSVLGMGESFGEF